MAVSSPENSLTILQNSEMVTGSQYEGLALILAANIDPIEFIEEIDEILIKEGSSKDVYITADGTAVFKNMSDVSISDIGRRLGLKIEKGVLEALMTYYLFYKLKERNVKSHLLGIWNGTVSDSFIPLEGYSELSNPSSVLAVNFFRNTPELKFIEGSGYDYQPFIDELPKGNCMLPFEVITRYEVIKGVSSCTKKGEKEWNKFREKYNTQHGSYGNLPTWEQLEAMDDNQVITLENPLVEITTKYEKKDKTVDNKTADQMTGASTDSKYSAEKVADFALNATNIVKELLLDLGINIPDIKIEIGLDENGDLTIADVIGPDEIRMYLAEAVLNEGDDDIKDFDFSKQAIRNIYKEYCNWFQVVEKCQKVYGDNWEERFERLGIQETPVLNSDIVEAVNEVYAEINQLILEKINNSSLNHDKLKDKIRTLKETIEAKGSDGSVFSSDLTKNEKSIYLFTLNSEERSRKALAKLKDPREE
jgi:phosphoribosylaminoimidazole-succinocarboxamide synthase